MSDTKSDMQAGIHLLGLAGVEVTPAQFAQLIRAHKWRIIGSKHDQVTERDLIARAARGDSDTMRSLVKVALQNRAKEGATEGE